MSNAQGGYFIFLYFNFISSRRLVIGIGVEEEDRKHSWMEDAEAVSIIRMYYNNNNNNNNNNLYFTRVTQSNTGFDFRCGPPI